MSLQRIFSRTIRPSTAWWLSATLLLGSASAFGHSVNGAMMDPAGNVDTFTGLARITCFDDGQGNAGSLTARIRVTSAPVAGLYMNLQLLKGTRAISISDVTPGDADFSPYISLPGGNGVYTLMLNHTQAGVTTFDLEWHCLTVDNLHTGTEIIVDQYE